MKITQYTVIVLFPQGTRSLQQQGNLQLDGLDYYLSTMGLTRTTHSRLSGQYTR